MPPRSVLAVLLLAGPWLPLASAAIRGPSPRAVRAQLSGLPAGPAAAIALRSRVAAAAAAGDAEAAEAGMAVLMALGDPARLSVLGAHLRAQAEGPAADDLERTGEALRASKRGAPAAAGALESLRGVVPDGRVRSLDEFFDRIDPVRSGSAGAVLGRFASRALRLARPGYRHAYRGTRGVAVLRGELSPEAVALSSRLKDEIWHEINRLRQSEGAPEGAVEELQLLGYFADKARSAHAPRHYGTGAGQAMGWARIFATDWLFELAGVKPGGPRPAEHAWAPEVQRRITALQLVLRLRVPPDHRFWTDRDNLHGDAHGRETYVDGVYAAAFPLREVVYRVSSGEGWVPAASEAARGAWQLLDFGARMTDVLADAAPDESLASLLAKQREAARASGLMPEVPGPGRE